MNSNISINHLDVFPTRIWHMNLANLNDQKLVWINAIDELRNNFPISNGKSNKNGWQSKALISSIPCFSPLLESSRLVFDSILKLISPDWLPKYSIESWINVSERGGFNLPHSHPQALLSAVYYLKVPSGSGDIVFRDPRQGANLSPFHGAKQICPPNNSADIRITPKEGLLLIFPNWLEHWVDQHKGEGERISIALNAQPELIGINTVMHEIK